MHAPQLVDICVYISYTHLHHLHTHTHTHVYIHTHVQESRHTHECVTPRKQMSPVTHRKTLRTHERHMWNKTYLSPTTVQPIPIAVTISKARSKGSKRKLVGLFSLKRGKRDLRAFASSFVFELCFELWKMSLEVRLLYGVPLVSRIDKIIDLFCKRAL